MRSTRTRRLARGAVLIVAPWLSWPVAVGSSQDPEPSAEAVRFETVEVFVDAGEEPLAAYQFTLRSRGGEARPAALAAEGPRDRGDHADLPVPVFVPVAAGHFAPVVGFERFERHLGIDHGDDLGGRGNYSLRHLSDQSTDPCSARSSSEVTALLGLSEAEVEPFLPPDCLR